MTKRSGLIVFTMLYAVPLAAQTPQACEGLRSLSTANTVVTAAAVIAGSFTPPGSSTPNATIANLPAFCRVEVTLKPMGDSEIKSPIRPRIQDPGATRLQIRVKDLDSTIGKLKATGSAVVSSGGTPATLQGGIRAAIMPDPDGLYFVLIQAAPPRAEAGR